MPADILRITRGPSEGETIEIGAELHLGRGSEGLGGLGEDPQLSRRHARISRTESGTLQIEDLGSTNGTFLNGKRVTGPQPLRPGDEIALGTTKLTLGGGARETSIAPVVEDPAAGPDTHPTEIRPQVEPVPAARKGPPPASPGGGQPASPGAGAPGALPALPTLGGGGHPAVDARRDKRVPILAALLVLALLGIVAALVLGGGDDDEKTAASADGGGFDGTVYLMAHEQAPGQNAVYAYRYGDGRVSPVRLRQYPTGGTGAIDVTDTTFVDADQQVWTDEDKGFLFVTNQGSDTVAVFRIADDGALTPVPGSPFPSRGTAPVSVGVSGNTVAVAHKAVDGVRDLKGKRPSLTTFRLEDDGRLTPTGRPLEMGEGQTPTQAWVTANGKQAIVSDLLKGNYFTFELRDDNTARQASVELVNDEQRAQGIPLTGPPPPVASGQRGGPPPPKPQDGGGPPAGADGGGQGGGQGGGGQGGDGPPEGGGQGGPPPDGGDGGAPAPMGPLGAQGLVGHPKEPILYSTFSGESALAVHEYDERGKLKFVRGVPVRGGFLICWTDVSPDGRFLYAGITYSNSIAVFDLKDPRNPRPIQLVRMRGPGNAVNVRVAPEGGTLFAVSGRFTTVDPGGTGNFLHTLDIGPDGRVKEQATSPVQVPVGMDGQSVGLAVVPRR